MMNKIFLQGRLCADPEYKTTASGVSLCNFRLAVERDYRDGAGEKVTDFINCTAWRGTADFVAKYFGKGQMMLVVGALTSRNYEDKNGQKRTAYEVQADHVYFSGGGEKRDAAPAPAAAPPAYPEPTAYSPPPGYQPPAVQPMGNPAGAIMDKYQGAAGAAQKQGGWNFDTYFTDNPGDQQTFGLEEMDGDLPF